MGSFSFRSIALIYPVCLSIHIASDVRYNPNSLKKMAQLLLFYRKHLSQKKVVLSYESYKQRY